MGPVVSIVIPAYNVERYIRSTLESVKKQTNKNIEVIVVNDGSEDKTGEVAKQVLSNSEFPWKVIDQKNQGVSVARNVGLSYAAGEYVLFLDGDDLLHESFVEKMYSLGKKNDADIVFCKFDEISEKGEVVLSYEKRTKEGSMTNYTSVKSGLEILRDFLQRKLWIWTASAIYKREFLLKNNLKYTEKCRNGQDLEFTIKALLCAERVIGLDEVLAYYVYRKGSVSRSNYYRKAKSVEGVLERIREAMREKQLLEEFEDMLEELFGSLLFSSFLWAYIDEGRDDLDTVKSILKYRRYFKTDTVKIRFVKFALNIFPNSFSLRVLRLLYNLRKRIQK